MTTTLPEDTGAFVAHFPPGRFVVENGVPRLHDGTGWRDLTGVNRMRLRKLPDGGYALQFCNALRVIASIHGISRVSRHVCREIAESINWKFA